MPVPWKRMNIHKLASGFSSHKALVGTTGTVNGTSMDRWVAGGSAVNSVIVICSVGAVTALTSIVFTLEDSANDSAFAAIAGVPTATITATNTDAFIRARLGPIGVRVRRYIRVSAVITATSVNYCSTIVTGGRK